MKDWKVFRREILTTVMRLQPDILRDKSLNFRHGNAPNVAVVFKFGIIGIDRNDLVVLGLKQSVPQDLGVRLIKALTQHCQSHKINFAVVPLDQNGRPIDTDEHMTIRI